MVYSIFGVFESCLLDPFVLRKVLFVGLVRWLLTVPILAIDPIFDAHEQLELLVSLQHVSTALDIAGLAPFHILLKRFN